MNNPGPRLLSLALLCLSALSLSTPSHAQEPIDDPSWTARCNQLNASSRLIDTGSAPNSLLETTRGIPGHTFASVARERSAAGQHYVACALYYTAAMAERLGNGGKIDTTTAHTDVAVATSELKLATGQKLTFTDKLSRASDRMLAVSAPELTPQDMSGVLAAFGATSPAVQSASYAPRPAPATYAGPTAPSPQTVPVNCSAAGENDARLCQVQQHPSRSGVPPACTVNWSRSGPLSQKCADALFQQAESERNSGDCTSALTDYDNARQAAQNAGSIVQENLRSTGPRSECQNKLHPPAPDTRYNGKTGALPVGRYTCFSAPAMIANGGAYGTTIMQVGSWQGYAYIFNDHSYAGNGDGNDKGTYHMQGNNLIAESGPYKRNNIAATYMAQGVYKRPTLYLQFLDDNNKPIIGLGCTWDGPPAGH